MEDISKSLAEISSKLDSIITRVDIMEKNIEDVKYSADNMNKHITFIERVYSAIKSPFQRLIGGWLPDPNASAMIPRSDSSERENNCVRNFSVVPTQAPSPCE